MFKLVHLKGYYKRFSIFTISLCLIINLNCSPKEPKALDNRREFVMVLRQGIRVMTYRHYGGEVVGPITRTIPLEGGAWGKVWGGWGNI